MSISERVPWWVKICSKIVLSRLPVPYSFWKKMHLFEHGKMNLVDSAYSTFLSHAKLAWVLDNNDPPRFLKRDGVFTVLELGPGDSLFSGLVAHAMGADKTILVDSGDFATKDVELYASMRCHLQKLGYLIGASEEALCGIPGLQYFTQGTQSLKGIPDQSIDFCFSNAVLEHIPRDEFPLLVRELNRVMKPSAVAVHRVDLKDHLQKSLNNLRFSNRVWESEFMKKSGFYTNRIRFSEMKSLFSDFDIATPRVEKWSNLPVNKSRLVEPYRSMENDELLVSGFDIVLRKVCS